MLILPFDNPVHLIESIVATGSITYTKPAVTAGGPDTKFVVSVTRYSPGPEKV